MHKSSRIIAIWLNLWHTICIIFRFWGLMVGDVAEKWCSIKEIAAHLGVSRDTVLNWIAKNNMPAHKVGKLWKFQISEVDEWIRNGEARE